MFEISQLKEKKLSELQDIAKPMIKAIAIAENILIIFINTV